jgi:hypothetical protein
MANSLLLFVHALREIIGHRLHITQDISRSADARVTYVTHVMETDLPLLLQYRISVGNATEHKTAQDTGLNNSLPVRRRME